MTDDAAPITQRDGVVIIVGAALPLMYRAVLALIARRHRDGLAASPLLNEARTTLYRVCMSRSRRPLANPAPSEPCSDGQDGDLIGVGEAAFLLALSRRQVQRMAVDPRGGLGGIRVGRAWALDRGAVLALADERKARQRPDPTRPHIPALGVQQVHHRPTNRPTLKHCRWRSTHSSRRCLTTSSRR